jgi:hypothetical protein
MRAIIRLLWLAILAFILGCSGGFSDPVSPGPVQPAIAPKASQIVNNNRHLWGIWSIEVDPALGTVDISPMRSADLHMNMVHMMEVAPCNDCIKIKINSFSPPTVSLDLTLKHPVKDNLTMTGFDVRGIFITKGEYLFPEGNRLVSLNGMYPVLNQPDGYTSLFNPTEYPSNSSKPFALKYTPGKGAVGTGLSATLNPYIAYGQSNPRRMFPPGSEETRTLTLKVPSGKFAFGYAVDASWVDPGKPVIDPVTDFPPEANCMEAYKIDPVSYGNPTGVVGSTGTVSVNLYDHQGLDTVSSVLVECPDLFNGWVALDFVAQDGSDKFIFSHMIVNEKGAPSGGLYPVLIKILDTAFDPNLGEVACWFVSHINVQDALPPVAHAKFSPNPQFVNEPVEFKNFGSNDPDGSAIPLKFEWDFDVNGTWDAEGEVVSHSWSAAGNYYVQMRVTDDEGQTGILEYPLQVGIIEKSPFLPQDVTPNLLDRDASTISLMGDNLYVGYYTSPYPGYYLHNVLTAPFAKPVKVDIPDYRRFWTISNGYGYVNDYYMNYIYNLSDPAKPVLVSTIPVKLSNLVLSGGYLYGLRDLDSKVYLDIWDVSTPENPLLANSVEVPGTSSYNIKFCVAEGYIYLYPFYITPSDSIDVYDVDPPESASLVASFQNPTSGYLDYLVVSNGMLYAREVESRIHILDASNPLAPVLVNSVDIPMDFFALTISGDYAYFMGVSAMIADISNPSSVVPQKWVNNMGSITQLLVDGDRAYFIDYGSVAIVNNTVPTSPVITGYIASTVNADKVAYSGNYAAILKSSYNNPSTGVQVIDVSTPAEAYVHDCLVANSIVNDVAISGDYVYVLESGPNGLNIYHMQPGSPMTHVATFQGGQRIKVLDGLAYVFSEEGFSILNVNPPESVSEINFLAEPSSGEDWAIDVDGGYAYTMGPSTRIYDIDPPELASEVLDYGGAFHVNDLDVSNGKAMISSWFYYNDWYIPQTLHNLYLYDVDPPQDMQMLDHLQNESGPSFMGISILGDYAFVACASKGVHIYSMEIADNMTEVQWFNPVWIIGSSGYVIDIETSADMAYLATDDGFKIMTLY